MKGEEIRKLADKAAEVCERCSFEPYVVDLYDWELMIVQGYYNPRVEEALKQEGFELYSSHSANGALFLDFRRGDVRVVLVKEESDGVEG